MRESYVTVIPVVERDSGQFVGAVTSNDILQLVLNKGRA